MQKNSLKQLMLVVALFTMQAVFGTISAKPISGKVTSATDGEPLIGATVQVQGQKSGIVTDLDGNYTINAEQGQTLVFSYVGYLTKSVKVGGASTINVVLEEDRQSLEEVVVIGYGVQKKKLLTGATTQVKGENIAKLNTTNPLQAMQGQTPGVSIQSTSGQPGSGMKVNIRGLGTVGSSGPLYLIDGIGGDISTLNPADIESIDVLKDAASAAIYGAQAANGVVLVTTKNGRAGKAEISFDTYYGWQNVARKAPMLNSQEYMTIMNEQQINAGNQPYDFSSMKSIYDPNGNLYDTNWIDQMFKSNAKVENATNKKINDKVALLSFTVKNNGTKAYNEDICIYSLLKNLNNSYYNHVFTKNEPVMLAPQESKQMQVEIPLQIDGTYWFGVVYKSDGEFYDINDGKSLSLFPYQVVVPNEPDPIELSIQKTEAEKLKNGHSFFNLNGQKVNKPQRGLYIINGRKVVIK